MKNLISFSFLLFLLNLYLSAQESQPPQQEVEIKAKYKGKIEERKPIWKLNFDLLDAAYEQFKSKGYIFDQRFGKGKIKPPLPSLSSEELRKPWLRSIVLGEVGIFYPFYGRDLKKWKLTILDGKGKIFRVFSGEDEPPSKIVWDGRNEKGEVLDVSLPYFYTAEAEDEAGNISRTPEKPIKLSGILWQDGVNFIISVDGNEIFEEKSDKIKKAELLEESLSIIKEKAKVKVEVIVYGQNPELTKKRYENLVKYLRENLKIPKGKVIYVEGFFKRTGYETSRVDFKIL
ncbi:MAG: hypothetical protein ABDH49_00245 [Candidatus Hydrothermales bacterium]